MRVIFFFGKNILVFLKILNTHTAQVSFFQVQKTFMMHLLIEWNVRPWTSMFFVKK